MITQRISAGPMANAPAMAGSATLTEESRETTSIPSAARRTGTAANRDTDRVPVAPPSRTARLIAGARRRGCGGSRAGRHLDLDVRRAVRDEGLEAARHDVAEADLPRDVARAVDPASSEDGDGLREIGSPVDDRA